MTDEAQGWKKKRRRLWLALALMAVLLAIVVMPPMVSIGRYKSRITHLMSESLGRPVRLSAVELRLLPRPEFVLTDLTVEEDPVFGAEPVLRANTVTAAIRLMSLWRGRLAISTVSVDEASLNVVHTAEGRWNLDPVFRTAAKAQPGDGAGQGASKRATPLPYLEATNLRVNFKQGAEKLPFSLVSADLSLWQEQPGDWRVRLRGQPARTDVSLDLADTGLVRLEARAQRAAELRQMPVHVDLEWREAQLGQLARLVTGSDPGWRGDLTGELHLDGTAEAAGIKTRLRATGVHRAEFAPASPLDFDASCGFFYHFSERAMDELVCESPLGDGRIRVTGDVPGKAGAPKLALELDRIPAAAGLDALRTVRSDFAPGLDVTGAVSGKLSYAPEAAANVVPDKKAGNARGTGAHAGRTRVAAAGPLTGGFTVDGLRLSGEGLTSPIVASKMVLEAAQVVQPVQNAGRTGGKGLADGGKAGGGKVEGGKAGIVSAESLAQSSSKAGSGKPGGAGAGGGEAGAGQDAALQTTVSLPVGGAVPLTIHARLGLSGYQLSVSGQASLERARELARVARWKEAEALGALSGEAVTVDLAAAGPWMPAQSAGMGKAAAAGAGAASGAGAGTGNGTGNGLGIGLGNAQAGASGNRVEDGAARADSQGIADSFSGSVTLHDASWKADYLASPVEISQATLHFGDGDLRWDPVVLSYGPVKGTASLTVPQHCAVKTDCAPSFEAHFAELDASALQAAILGAQEQGTLLSTLIARLKPPSASNTWQWPAMEGTVKADLLTLGPVSLTNATAELRIVDGGAEIAGLDAELLGGHLHGTAALRTVGPSQAKPSYALEGHFEKLNPEAVGQLLGLNWTGRSFDADGKVDLEGFTDSDLAASAKGTLHFDWRRGSVEIPEEDAGGSFPAFLARFDRWTADAEIGAGAIKLTANQVQEGQAKRAVEGSLTLGDPPKVTLAAPRETQAQR